VVVTGIKGEGDTYHVACVKEKWPVGRGGRKKDVQLTYYGYLDNLGYAPSWNKAGEIKERISLKKPKGHNSFDVRGHHPLGRETERGQETQQGGPVYPRQVGITHERRINKSQPMTTCFYKDVECQISAV
jgi:hypothetical protein